MTTSRPSILCLTDLADFESLTARMPTADECARIPELSAEVPVLVIRRAGHDQLTRADWLTITIDTRPAPDPDGVRATVRKILHYVAEDLTNSADDLTFLARALGGPPPRSDGAEVLAELEKRRAEAYTGAEVLESRASLEP